MNFFGTDYFRQRTISADFKGRFYYGRVTLNIISKIRGGYRELLKRFLDFHPNNFFYKRPHSAISIAPAISIASFYFATFCRYLKMFLVFSFGGTRTTGCLLYEYKIKSGKNKFFLNITSVKITLIRFLPNFAANVLWWRRTTWGHFDYLFLQVLCH